MVKQSILRLMSLIDDHSAVLGDGAYVAMCNELKTLHAESESSTEDSRDTDQMTFLSGALGTDVRFTLDHITDIDKFVDGAQGLLRVDNQLKRYRVDMLRWNETRDTAILEKYEEECVWSYLYRDQEARLVTTTLVEATVENLKSNGIEIGDRMDFLEKQFDTLASWYHRLMTCELTGCKHVWLSSMQDTDFENAIDFIQRTYKAMLYVFSFQEKINHTSKIFRENKTCDDGDLLSFRFQNLYTNPP